MIKWDKAELEKFKSMLLKKKAEMLKEINGVEKDSINKSQRDASGDLSAYTFHMADVATDSFDREFSLGIAMNVQQKILYAIEEALKRIEDKTFGICLECEKPIAKQRLMAMPYAGLCVDCQSKEDPQKKIV
ncbi:MAG: TraR/DksA family transcriptional regulator [Candidatus Omnitrophica bacterium]|jgi:RNA polymerase-binding protein DksA|nr:TraR/DksA family transcriptional regulator [Candidatus Omnitrophota bacterium]